jgi:hypothetical protein
MPPSKKARLSGSSGGNVGGVGATSDKLLLPWQNVRTQDLLGTDYIEVDPINKANHIRDKHPTQIDFEYVADKPILFGPMTKFAITGRFDVKDDDAANWRLANDISKVILQYNWFEMLIKSVDVFHNQQCIASSNEVRFIPAYLHMMLYHYMHNDSKRYLCPQKVHLGYCIPGGNEDWNVNSQAWKDYAASAFANKAFDFDFYPLFQFPFFLGSNFLGDDIWRLIPLDRLGKIHVQFLFFDKQDHIFRKVQGAIGKSYRFVLTKFKMCLEEARLAPAIERQLASKYKFEFPGVTRLQLVDLVADASSTHKTVFQDIYLPEAVLIFCLDKQVASSTYNFGTSMSQNVFKDHRIKQLAMKFHNKKFSLKEPNFGHF